MKFRNFIIPGYLTPKARLFLFTLFIIAIILQIYFALILEVQITESIALHKPKERKKIMKVRVSKDKLPYKENILVSSANSSAPKHA